MHKISDGEYLLTYLILICLAEIVTAYVSIQAGIVFHISILFLLFIHSGFISRKKMAVNEAQLLFIKQKKKPSGLLQSIISKKADLSSLLIVLTLAPLIRILSLVMPLVHFLRIQWFTIISIAVYLSIIIIIRQQKLALKDHGLRWPKRKHLPIEIGIALIAIPFGVMEYLILRPAPLISTFSAGDILVAILILFIGTGLLEEIIFRGLLQKKTVDMMGAWQGMLFVTILFAVLHIGNLSFLDVLLVFFIGGLYGVVVYKTKSIIGVTVSHTMVNIMLFIVCPLTMV